MSGERTVELPETREDSDVRSSVTPRAVLPTTDLDPRFIGRFRVLRKIGEGGMGRVYEAEDPELRRRVAVKLLVGASSPAAVERLRREARSMAAIAHPNVVTVHEVGAHDGDLFVAMEYVEGVTLKRWIADDFRSWREVLQKFVQAAKGLEAAHRDGLVHRDFKPDNVMVANDGRVRVLDFGIAKAVADRSEGDDGGHDLDTTLNTTGAEPEHHERALGASPHSSTALTRTGLIMGTPRYMAPEQFDGREVDGRTDQFALCVALYEALFRLRPFAGDSLPALAEAVSEGVVRPIPTDHPVPRFVRRIVLRGLSPDPNDRFADMGALRGALELALERDSAKPAPASEPRTLSAPAFLAIVVGALALVVAVGIGVRRQRNQGSVEANPPATMTGQPEMAPAPAAPPPPAGQSDLYEHPSITPQPTPARAQPEPATPVPTAAPRPAVEPSSTPRAQPAPTITTPAQPPASSRPWPPPGHPPPPPGHHPLPPGHPPPGYPPPPRHPPPR